MTDKVSLYIVICGMSGEYLRKIFFKNMSKKLSNAFVMNSNCGCFASTSTSASSSSSSMSSKSSSSVETQASCVEIVETHSDLAVGAATLISLDSYFLTDGLLSTGITITNSSVSSEWL